MGGTYRAATVDDIDRLCEIELAAHTYSADLIGRRELRHLITRGHADVVVAEEGDRIVGFAVVLLRRGSRVAHGWWIAFDPSEQHHGLATGLFDTEERSLAERGYTAISFEVRCDNERALALYESLGYRVTEDLTDRFGDGVHGVRMVKVLDD